MTGCRPLLAAAGDSPILHRRLRRRVAPWAAGGRREGWPAWDGWNHIRNIEDDSAVAEQPNEGIGREGYDMHWQATGEGGVAYARDSGSHLIVLDVRLPDGWGFELLQADAGPWLCGSDLHPHRGGRRGGQGHRPEPRRRR